MSSKHLYIIGNGFDLHHGMRTDYREFRSWLLTNDPWLLEIIDETFGFCDEELRRSFEENLATAQAYDIALEEVVCNFPDFGSEDYNDLDWFDAEFSVEDRIVDVYSAIRQALNQWIAGVENGDPSRMIPIERENSIFLNFNYSHTLQNLYGIPDERILHIHGNAGAGNDLILGHGKSYEDIEKEMLAGIPAAGGSSGDEDDFPDRDAYDLILQRAGETAVASIFEQNKFVQCVITENKGWFHALKDVTHIHFYGHSFSAVDQPYFSKILASVDRRAVVVEASCYSPDDMRRIDEFFGHEGVVFTPGRLDSFLYRGAGEADAELLEDLAVDFAEHDC